MMKQVDSQYDADFPPETEGGAIPAFSENGEEDTEETLFWNGVGTKPKKKRQKGERKSKNRKKTGKRKIVLSILGAILVGIIGFGVWFMCFYEPKTVTTSGGQKTDSIQKYTGNKTNDDDYVQPIKDDHKDQCYNFLVAGVDKLAGLSDVMMLVQFNTVNDTINVIQVPRDTFYSYDSVGGKMNSYYAVCKNYARSQGSENPEMEAIEGLKAFYEEALDITIDRYLCVDTAGFRDVIDAIGGVDFTVPMDMDYEDPEQDLYIHLKAGYQHLDGDHAEQFVRYRHGYAQGDIGRLDAQKGFLTAVATSIQKNLTVSKAVEIAKTLIQYMTTDLSVGDMAYFAKEAYGVSAKSINFITMPGYAHTVDGCSYYILHRVNALEVVNKYLNSFEEEITEESFDHARVFTIQGYSEIDSYYNAYYEEGQSDVTNGASLTS